MKATELMIGDWVKAPAGYMNVQEINPDFLYWNEIEPIILTEAILMKNFPDTDILVWRPVDYPDKSFVIDYWEEEIDGIEVHMSVRYVHELQHLLHLLDIDKEVEL